MRRINRMSGVFAFFALLFTSISSVQAADISSQPTKEEIARARASYNEGQRFFNAGQYQDAKASFQSAYDVVPNPIVLLSIAESEAHLGQLDDAVANFERYLQERPDAADRANVEARINEIKKTPATLAVLSNPSGADIEVDGQRTQKTTPAEIEVAPGEHTIEVLLSDQRKESRTIVASFGKRDEVQIEFAPQEPIVPMVKEPIASESAENQKSESSGDVSSYVPWIVMGVGAAMLVTGTALGIAALSEESAYNRKPTAGKADSGEQLALFADVSFGIGLAAVATGVVLLFTLDHDGDQEKPVASLKKGGGQGNFRLNPVISSREAGLSARIQF
jgi:tetratricopeptide (TPR) repeat protein